MGCCKKCGSMSAIVLILIGVAFMMQDWGSWYFWDLSWYTVAFLYLGIVKWGCSSCKDCGSCKTPAKGKKKK